MRLLAALVVALCASLSAASSDATAGAPALSVAVNSSSGVYTIAVDGKAWYMSPADLTLCVAGKQLALTLKGTSAASGSDAFGIWSGTTASFATAGGATAVMDLTFKLYTKSTVVVGTASFPTTISTAGCGANADLSTHFPAFSTTAGRATELHTLSWRGDVIATTAAATGLGSLGASGLDCGPVASTDPETGVTLVISTLDNHKILPQKTGAENALLNRGFIVKTINLPRQARDKHRKS